MAQTDHPLKRLIAMCIKEFSSWLLGATVHEATPRFTELPNVPVAVQADQVFQLTMANGVRGIMHLEYQGRSTHKPMPKRMLHAMVRLADDYDLMEMENVVIYIGKGAGADDSGGHLCRGITRPSSLTWDYTVIRLWEIDAEQLIATGRPAIMVLVGQSNIRDPATVIPKVVHAFTTVADVTLRGKLVTLFLALIDDQEVMNMAEHLLEQEHLLLDTPFLQRLRAEGREEALQSFRNTVLDTLQVRFQMETQAVTQLETALSSVTNAEILRELVRTALQAEDVKAFQTTLEARLEAARLKNNEQNEQVKRET